MKKVPFGLWSTGLLLTLCLAAGCGGGGGEATRPSLQELAGVYHGTWSRAQNGDTGEVDLTVAADGTVSGSCIHSDLGPSTLVTGRIWAGGRADIAYEYPFEGSDLPLMEQHKNGTLHFESDTRLSGVLMMNAGDIDVEMDYSLTKE